MGEKKLSSLQDNISVMFILNLLKKGWKLMVIFMLLGAAAAYAISTYFITPQYSSNLSLYVTNSSTMNGASSSSDLNYSSRLARTYIIILQEATVREQVANKLHTKVSAGQLSSMVTLESVDDTEVIKISATSSDPELSAEICNVYGSVAPEVLQRVVKAGSVEIIGKAKASSSPISPNIRNNTLYGAAAGVAAAIIVVLLRVLIDNTVQSEEEFKRIIGIPVWASIPSFTNSSKDKRHKGSDAAALRRTIINSQTPFAITEAYKNARTSMSFSITDSSAKAVVITSCEPDAGKSTTVANLAMTMAKTNAKVLIVDSDLRKPIQHKYFKIDNSRGLSGVLAGHYSVGSCIKEVAKNLYLMPSGVIPPNPSELIASRNMSQLIKELKNVYDYIFFDAPPASVVTDATVLAPKVDGVVFIVRQNRTEYGDVQKIIDDIRRLDGKILGTIITDSSNFSSIGLSRYKAYDYHYGGVSIKNDSAKKQAESSKEAAPKLTPAPKAPKDTGGNKS
ncbi:MAG: polysaccharide biosynthesis tyrosine autokinase [Clostridia bacterium]|nr:polysaccharide biosynthesis tyrosine autokinase [Clostridia bacterium]